MLVLLEPLVILVKMENLDLWVHRDILEKTAKMDTLEDLVQSDR